MGEGTVSRANKRAHVILLPTLSKRSSLGRSGVGRSSDTPFFMRSGRCATKLGSDFVPFTADSSAWARSCAASSGSGRPHASHVCAAAVNFSDVSSISSASSSNSAANSGFEVFKTCAVLRFVSSIVLNRCRNDDAMSGSGRLSAAPRFSNDGNRSTNVPSSSTGFPMNRAVEVTNRGTPRNAVASDTAHTRIPTNRYETMFCSLNARMCG